MGANFNEIIDRNNTSSVKWDILNEEFGRDDVISMWVSDMDAFKSNILLDLYI